uniref:Uncharacterized protein n=1 Tax=Cajanus cajan TaxID=3821 RepID=A0A151RC40_CAJCA|nr:hypothetical protein KK1_038456 [Cajanus cajan]
MSILTENVDLFAWSSAYMPGIDPNFICHKLAIYKEASGKFAANWKGPFRILECLQNGAYTLAELSGKVLPRTWNATHLKFYFN